ncbi:hypothetical protein SmJEL517_g04531 [Synchytrium microbalum]|uniref:SPX domain-containing protein n=1 Tax=Synchytrium microbalum TaxID=1806994 RepID=A0A507C485_9FUNG|nr:uncharacterized protein SmJEL517_g04531 [Synchytrium microbalum]TPX32333.1 hypothetical protein SmJEL517_g04531 [Synchytrium microbalum]
MKFGKYIEAESVPEWKAAYLDYKAVKKQLKELPFLRLPPPSPGGIHHNSLRRNSMSRSATELRQRGPGSGGSLLGGSRQTSPGLGPSALQSDEEFLASTLRSKRNEEKLFFALLDAEVGKAQKFYEDREAEALNKYEEIEAQCRFVNSVDPPTQPSKQPVKKIRELLKTLDGYVTAKGNNIIHLTNKDEEHPTSETPPVTRADVKRLRKAILEYYRSLSLLKNYQTLNRVALEKSLKKYARHFEDWGGRAAYARKVLKLSLFDKKHDVVPKMITKTEQLYASTFADGDKKRAMQRLRLPDLRSQPHLLPTWRSGIYLGISLGPIFTTIHNLLNNQITSKDPYTMLQLYGGFAIPILASLLFSIDLYYWSHARINYVFIFQLDPRNFLVLQEYIEVASFVVMMWSIFLYLTVIDNIFPFVPSEIYPVIFAGLVILIFVNPFNVMQKTSRYWFLSSLIRIVLSGLYEVEFRDFFLADQLNSMTYFFVGLMYFGCALQHGLTDTDTYCNGASKSWVLPVIAGLPPFWRLMQCGRRFIDSGGSAPHALNAIKYILSLAVIYLATAQNIEGDLWLRVLWIVVSACASLYATAWDVFWDWGLGKNTADMKHPFLRNDLAYPFIWASALRLSLLHKPTNLYYLAMPLDLVLRFGWIITLSPSFWVRQFPALGFVLAIVEIGRRTLWNLFRMENEHVNNVGNFRAFLDMPLPFEAHALRPSFSNRRHPLEVESDPEPEPKIHFAPTPKGVLSGHRAFDDMEMEPLILDNFDDELVMGGKRSRTVSEKQL